MAGMGLPRVGVKNAATGVLEALCWIAAYKMGSSQNSDNKAR